MKLMLLESCSIFVNKKYIECTVVDAINRSLKIFGDQMMGKDNSAWKLTDLPNCQH